MHICADPRQGCSFFKGGTIAVSARSIELVPQHRIQGHPHQEYRVPESNYAPSGSQDEPKWSNQPSSQDEPKCSNLPTSNPCQSLCTLGWHATSNMLSHLTWTNPQQVGIVLNNGSQWSYITDWLQTALLLHFKGEQSMSIVTFGFRGQLYKVFNVCRKLGNGCMRDLTIYLLHPLHVSPNMPTHHTLPGQLQASRRSPPCRLI